MLALTIYVGVLGVYLNVSHLMGTISLKPSNEKDYVVVKNERAISSHFKRRTLRSSQFATK